MQQEVIDGFRFSTPTTVAHEQVEVLTALARLRRCLLIALPREGAEINFASQISRAHQAETCRSDLRAAASFGKNLGPQTQQHNLSVQRFNVHEQVFPF